MIYWRDIPAQVNAPVGRDATRCCCRDSSSGRSTGPSARRRSTRRTRTSPSGGATSRPCGDDLGRRGRRRGRAARSRPTYSDGSASARSPSPAAGTDAEPMPDRDASRVWCSRRRGLSGDGRRRHDRARRGAAARRRPRHGVRRPRHLRPLPGRARVGAFAKWAITHDRATLERAGRRSSATTTAAARSSPAHRLGCAARDPRRRRGRRAGGEPGPPPGRAQGPRPRRRSSSTRRSRLVLRRGAGRRRSSVVGAAAAAVADAARRGGRRRQHGALLDVRCRGAAPSLHRRRSPAATATVAVRDGDGRRASGPATSTRAYGVAVDVGSTTIAGHLCDLATGEVLASAGRMNPQIRFGEDLMSRVSYVMMNPGGDARAHRRGAPGARRAGRRAARRRPASTRDRVLEVVLVGNPIMHHIVLGIDPTPLGQAPFALATDEAVDGPAGELELDLPIAALLRRAVHRRPRRRRHRGGDARRGPAPRRRRCSCSSTSAPTPRSCSATATASSPRRARPARRSKAPRSAAGSGRRPGAIERVRIDPRHARAAVQGDRRRRRGATSPASPTASPPAASPACAARGSSTSSPRCTSPG